MGKSRAAASGPRRTPPHSPARPGGAPDAWTHESPNTAASAEAAAPAAPLDGTLVEVSTVDAVPSQSAATDSSRQAAPEPGNSQREDDEERPVRLPFGVRLAAAWSWRLLLITFGVAVLGWLIVVLNVVIVPLILALLATALLLPLQQQLIRWRVPRWIAVLLSLLAFIAGVALLLFLIITQVRSGFSGLEQRTAIAYQQFLDWLSGPPLHFSKTQFDDVVDQTINSFKVDQKQFFNGALSVTTTLSHTITGIILAIFSTLFFMIDGKNIWRWVVRFMPSRARAAVDGGGKTAWSTLSMFVRVQIFVAMVNGTGVGIGAALLGLPLAVPIGVLVFIGSFIPLLGAIVTGALAVFIGLVYGGPTTGLVMLIILVVVNQLEGHVLQPLIMGSAVKVHPLGVVLAVATGTIIAGITGALFAVPLVATMNSMVNYITSGDWRGAPDPYPPTRQRIPRD